ncbi:4Fe-4S dicluster domain-containing protein [Desulfococcaceae bacterium HSG8]|nr:4Fe-4S dicluster domain-containing protein [Desulfococcaceae bacterium HSG8]
MIFTVSLYISLAIFTLGLIYRVSNWFSRKIGVSARNITTPERFFASVEGILRTLFSPKLLVLLKVFLLDVVLQIKILKENFLRWIMHILIYWGFMLLLLMHALDTLVTESLFSDYYSTVNPFFFLRDFFGVMVLTGVGIAVYRRFIMRIPRLRTNVTDHYAIIILAVIMISGVLLEGTKIISHTEFQRMVEDYAGMDDAEEIRLLESFWTEEYSVVSPNVKGPFDRETLEQGEELHLENCAECHSPPQSAFAGYVTAKIMTPFARELEQGETSALLWYIHFLACFLGLAYLPFSKMFHIIAAPISLLANAVMEKDKSDPANTATRQMIELDACTHCGTCSLYCSSMMAYEFIGNNYILPSEKMAFLKILALGEELSPGELQSIREGVCLCTDCQRCTVVCPSGIRLKELWPEVKEELLQKHEPEPLILSPFAFIRSLNWEENLTRDNYLNPVEVTRRAVAADSYPVTEPLDIESSIGNRQSVIDNTYACCFGCQNCTTVCPTVANYENPQEVLGLLPHQIMCCMGLGQIEMASGCRMIWDCLTCYQCQEHCPQNVRVTDIFFELKTRAVRNSKKISRSETFAKQRIPG